MRKDYDSIEFSEEDEFLPNIKVEADELPDDYIIPLPLYKFMFNLTDTYDIEEDGYLSDKLEKILNSIFEDFDEEVIDFDYNYDEDNIYIENIIWSD